MAARCNAHGKVGVNHRRIIGSVLLVFGVLVLLGSVVLAMPAEFFTASALMALFSAFKIKLLVFIEVFLRERVWQGMVVVFWKSLTLKKAALLSSIGLGKRFVIDVVVMGQVKRYYLEKIAEPVGELMTHLKVLWRRMSPLKKGLSFLPASVAGAVLHSLGLSGTLLKNTLTAKFWSQLLILIFKLWAAIGLFITELFIQSWLTPLIEVFFISILLKQLKRIPLVYRFLESLWNALARVVRRIADLLQYGVRGRMEQGMGYGAEVTTRAIHKITRDEHGKLKMPAD